MRGRTALHHAAAAGYTDVALLLVERGADVAAADADGISVLDAANGKLGGRGRNPGAAHPATAEALQSLIAP
jgi:hypothetical protein